MIDELLKETKGMDEKYFSQLETQIQAPINPQPILQPKKGAGVLKKVASAIGYGLMTGLTIVTFNLYHPNDAKAGEVITPNNYTDKIVVQQNNNTVTLHNGVGYDKQGNMYVAPVWSQKTNTQNTSNYNSQTKPTFNYKTAKQYNDKIEEAYQKGDYLTMKNLADDAINKEGKLKATPTEYKTLRILKEKAEYLINKH